MRFDVLSCFPEMIRHYTSLGIVGRAAEKGIITICARDLRDYAHDRYRHVDDTPYGGGPGMVLRSDVAIPAVEACLSDSGGKPARLIYTSPAGRRLDQEYAEDLSFEDHVVILCGRYEGVDQRIIDHFPMEEVSLGDFVLTGGELCAMCLIDAVTRLIPEALGDDESSEEESFTSGLLEYPQYTKPAEYMGMEVPRVLLGGNHGEIRSWRRKEMLRRTLQRRPDLLEWAPLSDADKQILETLKK
ncbi:MAG: tRNA (guanosine(37)-N1)-methyltransferase TrmD [Abditibacteriota bacterium]|nr:tRNA (guanosine(37)-N1)-methyltransferase TrmD [Abditibacteriota bacterium]